MKEMKTLLMLPIIMLLSAFLIASVWASSSGITGQSQLGCTCHSLNVDPGTTVEISGIPNQPELSETYELTVNVTSTTVNGTTGGFNLNATVGTFASTDPNVKIQAGEATHQNNFARSWLVNWTAPSENVSVSFYVAGLAANDKGGSNGDVWNLNTYSAEVIPEFPSFVIIPLFTLVSLLVGVLYRRKHTLSAG